MIRPLLFIFLLLSLSGCQSEAPHRFIEEDQPYFALRELVDTLTAQLKSVDPLVKKTVRQGDSTEVQTLKIADWSQELQLFREADINKPVLRDSYATEQNGDTLWHHAKTEEVAVREMRVVRTPTGTQVWVRFRENSRLFSVKRELYLETDQEQRLQKYQIDSRQHIALKEKQRYQIEGQLAR